jgi:hypothetical protein
MRIFGIGVVAAAVSFANGHAFGQGETLAAAPDSSASVFLDGLSPGWLSPTPAGGNVSHAFNWSESPILINAHQYDGYNDNVLSAFPSVTLQPGLQRGDFYNFSTIGASTKFDGAAQQFFANGSYTKINYLHDTSLDTSNYSLNAGTYWRATSRCNGQIQASSSVRQSLIEESFAPGIDNVHTDSFTERGTCNIYQNLGVEFNGGLSSIDHSLQQVQKINNDNWYMQGGLKYQLASLDQIRLLVKYTDITFTNAADTSFSSSSQSGLLTHTAQTNYQIFYDRTLPKLDIQAMAGLSQNPGTSSSASQTRTQETVVIYSASVNWRPSERWSVMLAAGRNVGLPISLIANTQISDTQSASLTYYLTPKVSLITSFNRTQLEGNSSASSNLSASVSGYGASIVTNGAFKAVYQVTPFTAASIAYQRYDRSLTGGNISSNSVLLGLDFQPQ